MKGIKSKNIYLIKVEKNKSVKHILFFKNLFPTAKQALKYLTLLVGVRTQDVGKTARIPNALVFNKYVLA